ncbi:hypothetical protein NQ314_008246 [Rhamnusium bicolor]|uniref:Uncharacterized protein n=1 Tax=Rhamnusium bicolor TaxID=1586634 RepID=A0AAV8YFP7_9CUCU|nr:hypothetical protein NQ314_008246 [Rhamnusium bicolor]
MAENLPDTLTPSSQEVIRQPWGRLVSCLSTLESVVIDKSSFKIGRGANCDVIIDKNKIPQNGYTNISKEHCLITKEPPDTNIYLKDLSKNGTYLNSTNIRKDKVILKDNDKIAMGQKNLDVYVFQSFPMDVPDTLTPSMSNSPAVAIRAPLLPTWGRLISCMLHLDSFDLSGPTFKVGRSSLCDAVIDRMGIGSINKNKFSKEHFLIVKNADNNITYITDLSRSGTYLNGRLIGRNNRNILQNDDTIGISPKKTRVYVYKSMYSLDANYLPPELRRKYEPSIVLGKGACGEVRLVYEKCTCKMYAVKKILKARSTASQMHKLNHPSKIHTEINILQSLSHPFVIHMEEIVETQDEVFFVLEYMKGGELNNRILSAVPLTESNIKCLFYQIVLAVQFLHTNGITHRDLKPENVLLFSDDVETLVKVSDFGLSKVTDGEDLMTTVCGTLQYIAPEILDARIPEYDKQVDVWSLGVILFYMLSKNLPFKSPDRGILCKLIISGSYNMDELSWSGISHLARDLIKRMLTVDPQQRITISAILNHPWLAKDIPMQYRVQAMLQDTLAPSERNEMDTYNMEPPYKTNQIVRV